jgi:hypothetical protein
VVLLASLWSALKSNYAQVWSADGAVWFIYSKHHLYGFDGCYTHHLPSLLVPTTTWLILYQGHTQKARQPGLNGSEADVPEWPVGH